MKCKNCNIKLQVCKKPRKTGLCRSCYLKEYRKSDKFKEYNKQKSREYRKTEKFKKYKESYKEQELKNTKKYYKTLKGRFNKLKVKAKNRSIELKLSFEQYEKLVKENKCHYCQLELPETGYGLDRKNNKIGYTIKNSVPCCSFCNAIKSNLLTYKETKYIIKKLKEFRKCQKS